MICSKGPVGPMYQCIVRIHPIGIFQSPFPSPLSPLCFHVSYLLSFWVNPRVPGQALTPQFLAKLLDSLSLCSLCDWAIFPPSPRAVEKISWYVKWRISGSWQVSWESKCNQTNEPGWNLYKQQFLQILDWEVSHLSHWFFSYPQSGLLWAPPCYASTVHFPRATLTGWSQYGQGEVAMKNKREGAILLAGYFADSARQMQFCYL